MKQNLTTTKVYNHLSVNDREDTTATEWQRSQTIPDQTFTLRELLDRHGSGLALHGFTPIYEEDFESNGVNPKTLDLSELQKLTKQNAQKLQQLKKQADTEQIQLLAEEKQKRLEEAKKLLQEATEQINISTEQIQH